MSYLRDKVRNTPNTVLNTLRIVQTDQTVLREEVSGLSRNSAITCHNH